MTLLGGDRKNPNTFQPFILGDKELPLIQMYGKHTQGAFDSF